MKRSVGIIGYGWVGKSQKQIFPDAPVFDEPLGMGSLAEINECDLAFIAVPTPNMPSGKLDTSIVEKLVQKCTAQVLCIRSTVNPGDTDNWKKKYNKRIVVMPEYLGESPAHPMLNQGDRHFMIMGGDRRDTRVVIEAYQQVYNANINIRQVTNYEAEVIKLSENRAIMFKVMQCQELYDACQQHNVDYYTVRDAVYGDDPRFNLWFTFVYPDERGASSKCIPKDVIAWSEWAGRPVLTETMLEYNEGLVNGR